MRLYKSAEFTTKKGIKDEVITIVMTDEERELMEENRQAVAQLRNQLRDQGGLPGTWNYYDDEAIDEILRWTTHFCAGGKMQDLTIAQMAKVNRMLAKIDDGVTFLDLGGMDWDPGYDDETFMTRREMGKEMARRRTLKAAGYNGVSLFR